MVLGIKPAAAFLFKYCTEPVHIVLSERLQKGRAETDIFQVNFCGSFKYTIPLDIQITFSMRARRLYSSELRAMR